MRNLRRESTFGVALTGLLTLLSTPAICTAQDTLPQATDGSYGYVRITDGSVTLIESDTGENVPVEGTEAVLAGDEVRLSAGARAEIVLADRSVLRVAEQAELRFVTLAGSADRSDRATALGLRRGSMQITVPDDYVGEVPPSVETDNAYIELRGPGTYLIWIQSPDRTLAVVRSGAAQVRAGDAVTALRSGQEALVERHDGSRVLVASARGLTPVENWGESLTAASHSTEVVYVDEPLRYAAAPLNSHGSWIHVRGTRAWRPHVRRGWRPYWNGRWRYTPSGLLWVSYEPWGWVPYHYGSWDLVPGYGWVWFPGHRFASAWVFWYWGPEYVGWVPWGYYSHRYRNRFNLSFAVYGSAGGLFVNFGDWCFSPVRRFGRRHQRRYLRTGRGLGHERGRLERGVITTDTRKLTPGHWTSPDRVNRILTTEAKGRKGGKLEDVSPFIYRERNLRIADGWKPPPDARLRNRERPLVDPVRNTPIVTASAADLGGRTPARTKARDKVRQDVARRPAVDPVRKARTVERRRPETPARTEVRERSPRQVKSRPSIDRARRPIVVSPRSTPRIESTSMERTVSRSHKARSSAPKVRSSPAPKARSSAPKVRSSRAPRARGSSPRSSPRAASGRKTVKRRN